MWLYHIWHPVQHWFYSSWWGQDVFAGGILSIVGILWAHFKTHAKLDHIIKHHPDIPPFKGSK